MGVSRDVWITGGILLPFAAAGAGLGHLVSGRVSEAVFRAAVLILIGATGVFMLLEALLR